MASLWHVTNAHTFDQIISRWGTVSGSLPARRTGDNRIYSMADITLAVFIVFFTQCPSFLSYQQAMEQSRGRHNAQPLLSGKFLLDSVA